MCICPGLVACIANSQDIFGGCRRIEMEFLARPLRNNADGCGGRKPPVFRLATKIYVNSDMAAAMTVDVVVAFDFEDFEREADVGWRMGISAVFNVVGLGESLFALANKHENIIAAPFDHACGNEYLPQHLPAVRGHYLRLCTTMEK